MLSDAVLISLLLHTTALRGAAAANNFGYFKPYNNAPYPPIDNPAIPLNLFSDFTLYVFSICGINSFIKKSS